MYLKRKLIWSLGVFAVIVLTAHANASSISQTYTGTLSRESGSSGSVVLESFSLTAPSEATIFTTSYGGPESERRH